MTKERDAMAILKRAEEAAVPPELMALLVDAAQEASGFAAQQKADVESLKRSSQQVNGSTRSDHFLMITSF